MEKGSNFGCFAEVGAFFGVTCLTLILAPELDHEAVMNIVEVSPVLIQEMVTSEWTLLLVSAMAGAAAAGLTRTIRTIPSLI